MPPPSPPHPPAPPCPPPAPPKPPPPARTYCVIHNANGGNVGAKLGQSDQPQALTGSCCTISPAIGALPPHMPSSPLHLSGRALGGCGCEHHAPRVLAAFATMARAATSPGLATASRAAPSARSRRAVHR
eukprot:7209999-Prymnesium_polylepis.1